jgi:DNA replication protein DnaC
MTDPLYERVQHTLKALDLRTIPVHLDSLTQQAATENWSALQFLDALTQTELAARNEHTIRRKMRAARFPFQKTLDEFDFAFQPSVNERQIRELATLRFVASAENILFLGPPGVGKTHLVVSLGMCAILQGMSVLFYALPDLIQQLAKDAKADRLSQRLQALARPQLLILDEVGYFSLDKRSAHFLFQLVSRRYQRGSILLTSNKSYSDWGDVFSDTVLASALLDRLLHHSLTVNIRGASYRLKDKLKVMTPSHQAKEPSPAAHSPRLPDPVMELAKD